MKIGVIADTHIPAIAAELPSEIYSYLKNCDCIVHAGDVVDMSLIEELRLIADTYAVSGNMDSFDVKKTLPEKLIFEVAGKSIGVVHGRGNPAKVLQFVEDDFKNKKLDIIIFGHSHVPFNGLIDGTIYFNPGSVTDRVFAPYRSFGIITIEKNEINAEIIRLP